MSELKHIEVKYRDRSYEIDVNPNDTLESVINDLYFSIILQDIPYSLLEKSINYIKMKSGSYVIKDARNHILDKSKRAYYISSYLQFEL